MTMAGDFEDADGAATDLKVFDGNHLRDHRHRAAGGSTAPTGFAGGGLLPDLRLLRPRLLRPVERAGHQGRSNDDDDNRPGSVHGVFLAPMPKAAQGGLKHGLKTLQQHYFQR